MDQLIASYSYVAMFPAAVLTNGPVVPGCGERRFGTGARDVGLGECRDGIEV